jgi:hypothetical protein
MTTPEHALVGVHLAIASRCFRLWSWRAVALAAVMSNAPDWDGVPMLFDMGRFEQGHRVWGHNLTVILFVSFVVALILNQWDLIGAIGKRIAGKYSSATIILDPIDCQNQLDFGAAFLTAFVSQAMHLPCDMVVSGGGGLSHWHVKPFWPIADNGYVYPLIPWGDIGPTIIMMVGLIVMAKRQRNMAATAAGSLATVIVYMLARKFLMG